ncbi:hypothetical protein Hanom_Chr02g00154711 [Helianthus anomalus]
MATKLMRKRTWLFCHSLPCKWSDPIHRRGCRWWSSRVAWWWSEHLRWRGGGRSVSGGVVVVYTQLACGFWGTPDGGVFDCEYIYTNHVYIII